jgi:hypothetical protein
MKKILFLLSACLVFKAGTYAQTTIEFIPTGGYTVPDQVNFYNTYGRIEGAGNWGGSLQFNVNRNFGIELLYNRMDAQSGIYDYHYNNQSNPPISQQKVGINYFMAGPVQSFGFPGSPVHLFFGGLLGAAVFSPNPIDNSSNTKFAWGFEAGTNVYVSPRFGIRLKAQLLSPVDNGGFYFGNFGYGGSAGYYSYASIYQFGFSAGFIIGLGSIIPAPRPRPATQGRPPAKRYYYRTPPPPPPGYYYHY